MLLIALCLPASAQESCDVKHSFEKTATGGRFLQILQCGDGDGTTELICVKGAKTVHALLPLQPSDVKVGTKVEAIFTIGGKKITRTLTAAGPVKGGSDDIGGVIILDVNQPLWKALSLPGTDIPTEADGGTLNVATVSGSRASMTKFRKACGL